ncbi:diacylglycerol/lipid kinase family protein [Rudaeicoccus suwonensis]|nr:diacylglycerol kinase family protein [Rudaeicoccus suwonensis]
MSADPSEDTSEARPAGRGRGATEGMSADPSEDTSEARPAGRGRGATEGMSADPSEDTSEARPAGRGRGATEGMSADPSAESPGFRAPFHVIVNPMAGGGRAVRAAREVVADLCDMGATVRTTFSPSIDAADGIVETTAERGEQAVVVGGDGFVSSLAGSFAARRLAFAIVPSGRGNDFARQLAIPANVHDAARLAFSGVPTPVDAIDAGGTIVVGSVYAGVDSLVSSIVNSSTRLPPALQYQLASMRGLLGFAPRNYVVTVDSETYEYEGFTAIAANSGYYGKGMHIAPEASVHDGLLDVVMIGAGSRMKFIRSFPQVYKGTHLQNPEIRSARGRSVRIEAVGVEAYADGEPLGDLPMSATVLPGALTVLLNEDRPSDHS